MNDEVICEVHGPQQKAYVCEHIVQTLHDGKPRGLCWSNDNGWCSACEDLRISSGGDWTDDLMRKIGVTLVCSGCFNEAKRINDR
jgi:hypothetical protein